MTSSDLQEQVDQFTSETETLLRACFDDVPDTEVETLAERVVTDLKVTLKIKGRALAQLHVFQRFRLDSTETFLAVEQSIFKLTAIIDRTPIVRYEYDRDARAKPSSHIHFHAHRGAISHLLSQAGHKSPHELASLHLPTGGARFRPCLEDFLEFLISDCRLGAKQGWEQEVKAGRERWRRLQVRSIVRDVPSEAIAALEGLGYTVQPPDEARQDSRKALHTW
ncbi:hypothetical protein ABT256_07175 [Amycolatopsis japonica]|uniref:hypothetical protein n=1 Tax=Amycolatopsis japonica TaxID=208439 RepID=UPI00331B1AA2